MSGLMSKLDGIATVVKLPRTLHGCKAWFEKNACTSNVVEICDIHVTDNCGGDDIEYTCAMYDRVADCAAADVHSTAIEDTSDDIPFSVLQEGIGHIGDVLFFKTRTKKFSFDDMEDVVQDSGVTFEEASFMLRTLKKNLEKVYPKDSSMSNSTFLFPVLWGSYDYDSDRKLVYGGSYDRLTMFETYGNVFEIDLLTWKRKNRALFTYGSTMDSHMAIPLPGKHESIADKIEKRNSMGFCKICHEITRVTCTRCCTFYSCGGDECHLKAWKLHKGPCKEKCAKKAVKV